MVRNGPLGGRGVEPRPSLFCGKRLYVKLHKKVLSIVEPKVFNFLL